MDLRRGLGHVHAVSGVGSLKRRSKADQFILPEGIKAELDNLLPDGISDLLSRFEWEEERRYSD